MSATAHAIELCGERIELHPSRAVIWPARRLLAIADPHFAKDDIFRRSGIALPRGPGIDDLQRITSLIRSHGCERLAILGDFVHGATLAGDSFPHAFGVWRRAHPRLIVDVIAGNHDRRESVSKWSGLANWHIAPLVEGPFVLAHEPHENPGGYVLAGHIHPVFRIRQKGGTLRVPVFWQGRHALVLPSFGSFTGGFEVAPQPGDRLYAAAPERVVPLAVTARSPTAG